MKIRITILAIGLTLGLLFASCGASKHTCPAYGENSSEQIDSNRS